MKKKNEIKKILTATDFSPGSEDAVRYAAKLAKAMDAELFIGHVVEQPALFGPYNEELEVPGGIPPETLAARQDTFAQKLQALADELGGEGRMSEGPPKREIVEMATVADVDVIVLGTHGRRGLARLLLGSTTTSVIRHAPCPVLSVPTGQSFEPADIEHILAPVDFSLASEASIDNALDLAQKLDAKITFVHVIDHGELTLGLDTIEESTHAGFHAAVTAMKDTLGTQLDQLAARAGKVGVTAHTELLEGDPHRMVVELGEALSCDLIVMGSVGAGAVASALLGSVADRVLRTAKCPVLTCGPLHEED